MYSKSVRSLIGVAAVAALVAAGVWYHATAARHEARTQYVESTLGPVAVLLRESQGLIQELEAEPFTEPNAGILAAYLTKIRRDGVARHADMKQRLDQLAANNTAIVTLLQAYAPHAATPAFAAEAARFHDYASSWRDRWNSVMEMFMAGGSYAVAGTPFPAHFPDAVQLELAASH